MKSLLVGKCPNVDVVFNIGGNANMTWINIETGSGEYLTEICHSVPILLTLIVDVCQCNSISQCVLLIRFQWELTTV